MIGRKRRRRIAALLRAAQGGLCCYCGRRMERTWDSAIGLGPLSETVEHLQRLTDGGTDHLDNLALACSACNSGRGDMNWVEFKTHRSQAQRGAIMINPRLIAAIHIFRAADVLIPVTADDDVMDAAVMKAAAALDCVRRIPAINFAEVGEKLVLASSVQGGWPAMADRLRGTAESELKTIIWNGRQRAA